MVFSEELLVEEFTDKREMEAALVRGFASRQERDRYVSRAGTCLLTWQHASHGGGDTAGGCVGKLMHEDAGCSGCGPDLPLVHVAGEQAARAALRAACGCVEGAAGGKGSDVCPNNLDAPEPGTAHAEQGAEELAVPRADCEVQKAARMATADELSNERRAQESIAAQLAQQLAAAEECHERLVFAAKEAKRREFENHMLRKQVAELEAALASQKSKNNLPLLQRDAGDLILSRFVAGDSMPGTDRLAQSPGGKN